MAFIYSIKDTYRAAVEAASGGKNTVLYDDKGNPSVMVVIPKFYLDEVMDGAPHTVHPAFIVNGIEKSCIYISKYQNIVQDGRAYSLPGQDPRTYVNFDQALQYCYNKGQGWHLMSRAEWAAIALWCKKNGFMPRGNNNYGKDHSAIHEKGVPTYIYDEGKTIGRVATGSGPCSWSHDGTPDGIYDLNGNVWEWNSGMRLKNGEIQVIENNNAAILGADNSDDSLLWKAISSVDGSLVSPGTAGTLKIDNTTAGSAEKDGNTVGGDPIINTVRNNPMYTGGDVNDYYSYSSCSYEVLTATEGINIPNIMKVLGLFPIDNQYDGDIFCVRNYGERFPFSGGSWNNGSGAGVFALGLHYLRCYSNNSVGCRAAYVL